MDRFHAELGKIDNHLIGDPFQMDDLKIAAARAAYVATLIRNPDSTMSLSDLRYDPTQVPELATLEIAHSQRLNRLKQANPEAFFYWLQVDRLLSRSG